MRVPQIVKSTEISADYFNQYFGFILLLKKGESLDDLAEGFKKFPVKKYEEVYSPKIYRNALNEKNKNKIKRLDEIADFVNANFTNQNNFDILNFKKIINEVYSIIHGENKNYYKV